MQLVRDRLELMRLHAEHDEIVRARFADALDGRQAMLEPCAVALDEREALPAQGGEMRPASDQRDVRAGMRKARGEKAADTTGANDADAVQQECDCSSAAG